MKRFRGTKGIILLAVLVVMMVGYYHYLSNKRATSVKEETRSEYEIMTPVQEVLSRNLETNYPPTPREVVRYFSEISQCFYNEDYSEEQLYQMAMKIREIYDDELVANQTEEDYLIQLKADIAEYKEKNRTIAGFSMSSTMDVEIYEMEGHEWAKLHCIYNIKESVLINSDMLFLLRRDADGHYKIFGWQLQENPTGDEASVTMDQQ
ncbi:MAG: hypothetical protein J6P60_05565 [Lachnospiraceae bacterium]|nr:hypothetical protein [Lachnospiraceae bacterium]